MKYLVFIDEGNGWEPQGDGPLGQKTAERIAREIRTECKVKTKVEPMTQANRFQVLLDGQVIYRHKDREMALVYHRAACIQNPYRDVRMLDTHTGQYIERP